MPRSLLAKLAGRSRLTIAVAVVTALVLALPVFAAVSFTDNGNNSPSLTLAKPAGVAEGHFMLAQVAFRGDSALEVNAPSGWTLIAERTNTENATAAARVTQATYYKAAGASEPANYQWTFGPTGATDTPALGGITSYDDVDLSSPIDASATNPATDSALAASTGPVAPEVTTTQAHARVVSLWAFESDATFTKPASMGALYSHGRTSGSAGTRARIGAADVIQTTAGLSGTKVATAGSSTRYVAQTIALRRKATDLAFTTSAQSGLKNTCLGPITVQSQGESSPVNVTADTVVDLTTDGTGSFFSDSGCTTAETEADRTIPAGSNSITFYYKATTTGDGSHQLAAAATGLTSGQQTQTITKLAQNITFEQPASPQTYSSTFNVNPTTDSPQPLLFDASGGCSAVPGTTGYDVTMTSGTTSCVLTASQDETDDYDAASVQRTVVAQKKAPTITFAQPSTPQTYGESFNINPTSDSPATISVGRTGPCSVASATTGFNVTMTGGTGNCVLTASQPANNDYTTANLQRTVAAAKRSVTVTADPQSKTYGDPDPALAYGITAGSLVGADTFSGALTRDAGETVAGGPYSITQGTLALETTDYDLSFVAGSLTITPKDLTANGLVANGKTYDRGVAATLDFTAASLTGIVGTDDVSLDPTNYTATFADKKAGAGKAVTIDALGLTGAAASNYTASGPTDLTATITKKAVTGSFTAADKDYDGTTDATILTRSLSGVIAGDSVSMIGGAADFGNPNPGVDKFVGGTGFSLGGTDAGNYNLTSVASTTATIRQRDPGDQDNPPAEDVQDAAEEALGGPVKVLAGFDLGGLGFAFAPENQKNTLKIGKKGIKLFAIGGCDAPCTVAAAKTIVLTTGGASAAATKKIKLKKQTLSLATGEFGVIKLKKLSKKQRKAIKKADKAKLVVKVKLESAGQTAKDKKSYKLKLKK